MLRSFLLSITPLQRSTTYSFVKSALINLLTVFISLYAIHRTTQETSERTKKTFVSRPKGCLKEEIISEKENIQSYQVVLKSFFTQYNSQKGVLIIIHNNNGVCSIIVLCSCNIL